MHLYDLSFSLSRLTICLSVPFFMIAFVGGPNSSVYDGTEFLHRINEITPISDPSALDCKLFDSSIAGWLTSEEFELNEVDVSLDDDDPRIVWAQLLPVRCTDSFSSSVIVPKPDECYNRLEIELCNDWNNASLDDLHNFNGLRQGSLYEVMFNDKGIETKAIFNLEHTISLT